MPNQKPQRLIIEYGDGSTKEVEFGRLSRAAQIELSKLGGFPIPSPLVFIPQKYLLLKWKDGWYEVTGIEEDSGELLRYYVIQRNEEAGRLVIERPGTYPRLIIISRRPKELEQVIAINDKSMKVCALAQEGIAVEGGKTEYHYKLDKNGENSIEEIIGLLKMVLKKDSLKAKELLARSDAQRVKEYERIRKEISLKASEREQDVLGFLQMLLQRLAREER